MSRHWGQSQGRVLAEKKHDPVILDLKAEVETNVKDDENANVRLRVLLGRLFLRLLARHFPADHGFPDFFSGRAQHDSRVCLQRVAVRAVRQRLRQLRHLRHDQHEVQANFSTATFYSKKRDEKLTYSPL